MTFWKNKKPQEEPKEPEEPELKEEAEEKELDGKFDQMLIDKYELEFPEKHAIWHKKETKQFKEWKEDHNL